MSNVNNREQDNMIWRYPQQDLYFDCLCDRRGVKNCTAHNLFSYIRPLDAHCTHARTTQHWSLGLRNYRIIAQLLFTITYQNKYSCVMRQLFNRSNFKYWLFMKEHRTYDKLFRERDFTTIELLQCKQNWANIHQTQFTIDWKPSLTKRAPWRKQSV